MTRQTVRMHGASGLRASLIRANPCQFAHRYGVTSERPVGQGTFGQVHCCMDRLAHTSRAVKRIPLPSDRQRQAVLRGEVTMLVALDHPHIVRLIEYFTECDEVLLVMELLEGPSLGEKMQQVGRFGEQAAAQCARHMLKALFCCHCQGIAHNDVSRENFKFQTPEPGSPLKMLDFGLSGRSCGEQTSPPEAEHGHFAQECDIWRAGAILFVMLSGSELFPACTPSKPSEQMASSSDPELVRSRLGELDASAEALGLLQGMLEPSSTRRLPAREALMHPCITRFYLSESQKNHNDGDRYALSLGNFVTALRSFHGAVRMKRLVLFIAAHLLTNRCDTMAAIHRLFRFLVRDGRRVEEDALRAAMSALQIDVPGDLSIVFCSADMAGKGGLDYIEFVAVAIIAEPQLYCSDLMLRAVFRFLDTTDVGLIDDEVVRSLFDLPMCRGGELVKEACDRSQMPFAAFQELMVPRAWAEKFAGGRPAAWADAPDVRHGRPAPAVVAAPPEERANPVKSLPSQSFEVCQLGGFHSRALRPFYAAQPVSNVLLGIVRGTSAYARGAARRGLASILTLDASSGAFFIMPNPKYHWTPEDVQISDSPRLRFVAWWIHPNFLDELSSWFNSSTKRPSRFRELHAAPGEAPEMGMGSPGDFGFSEEAKPDNYLHTYRDLAGQAHVDMLESLVASVGTFLERLLGRALSPARISVGFHYPVRPQYSTLHLQLRVNTGDVCAGKEHRGVDLFKLLAQLRADPQTLSRDDETLQYQATTNLQVALMSAAAAAGLKGKEVGADALILAGEQPHSVLSSCLEQTSLNSAPPCPLPEGRNVIGSQTCWPTCA